jgi:hypothetical protein
MNKRQKAELFEVNHNIKVLKNFFEECKEERKEWLEHMFKLGVHICDPESLGWSDHVMSMVAKYKVLITKKKQLEGKE